MKKAAERSAAFPNFCFGDRLKRELKQSDQQLNEHGKA